MIDLKEVITKYPECLESSEKLRAYLTDLYPNEKAKVSIIVAIFNCGIAEEIERSKKIDDVTIERFCTRLENDYGYSTKLARECIDLWLEVYGKTITKPEVVAPKNIAPVTVVPPVPKTTISTSNPPMVQTAQAKNAQPVISNKKIKIPSKLATIVGITLVIVVAVSVLTIKVILPNTQYNNAIALMSSGKYDEAISVFEKIETYSDSKMKITECNEALAQINYDKAVKLSNDKKFSDAYEMFAKLGKYKDSSDKANEALYKHACTYFDQKDYDTSNKFFKQLGDYKDSKSKIHTHKYLETIVKKATCQNKGLSVMKCDCGKQYDEIKPISDHEYKSATCTIAKQCTICGLTSGKPLEHSTGTAKCTRCGINLFETLTFSGTGSKTITGVNIPSGMIVKDIKFQSNKNFFDESMRWSLEIKCGESVFTQSSDVYLDVSGATYIDVPLNNATITFTVPVSSVSWEITLRAQD